MLAHTIIDNQDTWNTAMDNLDGGHLLQSWQWGELKSNYGWKPARILWNDDTQTPVAAAQLLFRTTSGNLTIAYCPRGPLLNWENPVHYRQVMSDLAAHASRHGAIFVKIDPEIPVGIEQPLDPEAPDRNQTNLLRQSWQRLGWRESREQIQFRNTFKLDLITDEEALLANMKQKTRYNIRLSARRGVVIRRGGMEDLDLLYKMYAETSIRDGFIIRDPAYYREAWGSFIQDGVAQPLIAEVENEAVAAIIIYQFGKTATYLYGMSRALHRDKMPNYLLQWEAIRWAKEVGCLVYDFWGAPDHVDPDDPMYGVYRFKEGFGAQFVQTVGAWDFPIKPLQYRLYKYLLPRLLSVMRLFGRARTRAQVDR
ncbi:MAG TPA: peptidoglycan bridge formation glycyltransferase FemA/FemB family protein [Anaerolineales bacterium]|nr:peptidoglycan bridge formation glycyltransferase FemA/FemB family protein [Anaerolineales bacterium]